LLEPPAREGGDESKAGSTARKATKAIDPRQQGGDRSLERSINTE